MPKVIGEKRRIRVELSEYRKTGRQYVPIKGLTFFISARSIAAIRRAHAVMLRELEKTDWLAGDEDADGADPAGAGNPTGVAEA